jgi:hypothetical protein
MIEQWHYGSLLLGFAAFHLEPVDGDLGSVLSLLLLFLLLGWLLLDDLLDVDDAAQRQAHLPAQLFAPLHTLLHRSLFSICFLNHQRSTIRGSQLKSFSVRSEYLRRESTR